jgi:hypothetical protein
VLKAANQNVKDCYEQALQAEERAAQIRNSLDRQFWLDSEARWLALAASYEYQARLSTKKCAALLKARFARPVTCLCDRND